MRKKTILLILFFGSLWGAVEAILGGVLYRVEVPRAAVPLSILALLILTIARVYCRMPGSSTLIAACAMLFKFTNAPFFGCHLLGILLLGTAHDLMLLAIGQRGLTPLRRIAKNALIGAGTSYLGFALFAVSITYLFRYPHWTEAGLPQVLDHVFVAGSLTAAGSAILVPLGAWIGELLKAREFAPFELRSWLTTGSVSVLTMVLWIVAATVTF